jgi:four helix bundle protein
MTKDEGIPRLQAPTAPAAFDGFWASERKDMHFMVVREEPDREKPVYDLEERTAKFGEAIIDFANLVPRGPTTDRLISQLVGVGTSVGANYCEADDAVSKKELVLRIGTCRKEAKFFLRMIVRAIPHLKPQARPLWQEPRELHLIFCVIVRNAK